MGAFIDYFGGVGGGGKKEGLYMWEKSTLIRNAVSIYARRVSSSSKMVFTLDFDRDIAWNALTAEDFIGMSMTYEGNTMAYPTITITSATQCTNYYNRSSGVDKTETVTWSWNATNRTITVNSGNYYLTSKDTAHWPLSNFTPQIKELVGFVVADEDTAFPNGGVLDGFYYDRLTGSSSDFGVECGFFVPSSEVRTVTINHSLGVKPTKFSIWHGQAEHSGSYEFRMLSYPSYSAGQAMIYYRDSIGGENLEYITPTITATKVTIPQVDNWDPTYEKGEYYFYALMA